VYTVHQIYDLLGYLSSFYKHALENSTGVHLRDMSVQVTTVKTAQTCILVWD